MYKRQVFLSLGPNYGRWLTLRETPQVMQDAMVAVEDRRFRYHPGLDPVGMVRAAAVAVQTVSYTHLDVYKRQGLNAAFMQR